MRNQWKILSKLAVAFAALVLAAGAGGFAISLVNRGSNSFRNLPEFPATEYRQGELLWNNSFYRLSGTLDNIVLESNNHENYLIAVVAKDQKASLPVVIPTKASKSPLQRQQNLSLKVSIDSSGRIIASDCVID